MRSDAAIACCRLAFTRLSFLTGPYIMNSGDDERSELALRQSPLRDLRGCRTRSAPTIAEAAEQLHQRRQQRDACS